jgi:hypothetical protein
MKHTISVLLVALIVWAPPALTAESVGIFETVLESSLPFEETAERLESAIADSALLLHGSHVVRLPDESHHAKIYVLTSPDYASAAATESARTISAQILRMAVYTLGDGQTAYINMANPVAHAMVFYSNSANYDKLLAASRTVANELRAVAGAVPGSALSQQLEPARTEKKLRKFNGDGPAKMMAKFRNWEESQLLIDDDSDGNFAAVVDQVEKAVADSAVASAEASEGWEIVSKIQLRDDAVYFGLTNPFIEDRMVRINSRFRSDGKTDAAPYPGVDHVTALPTDVLVIQEAGRTKVLHYGQMWRMQLYFWDSGYRAFTANVTVPGTIADSIADTIRTSP